MLENSNIKSNFANIFCQVFLDLGQAVQGGQTIWNVIFGGDCLFIHSYIHTEVQRDKKYYIRKINNCDCHNKIT